MQCRDQGAKLLTGGERDGAILSPAVVAGVDPQSPLSQDELFGPAVAVSSAEDFRHPARPTLVKEGRIDDDP